MSAEISEAISNAIAYLKEHRDEARYTDSAATAVLQEGLSFRVGGPGGESLATDMPKGVGGRDSAPSPGWIMRAALASCEATLIAMRAAQQGVTLEALEVTVDSESDDYGILGIDDSASVGPESVRVRVHATASGASGDDLRALIEWAHAHCPVTDAIARAVPVDLVVDASA